MHLERSNVYARLVRYYHGVTSSPVLAAAHATRSYYRMFGELPMRYERPRVLEFAGGEIPEILAELKKMNPQEAVKYLRSKGVKVSDDWRAMEAAAHQRAFTVAKVASADALTDIRNKLADATERGLTYKEFAAEITPKLKERGVGLTDGRLKNVYRTNIQSSMMAGRKTQMDSTMADFPWRQLVAINDNSTTDQCMNLNGKVARADDPFWDKYTPPLHFGCRTSIRSMTDRQLQREGLTPELGRDLELLTGLAKEQGFDVAPNTSGWTPDTAKYDLDVRIALETALTPTDPVVAREEEKKAAQAALDKLAKARGPLAISFRNAEDAIREAKTRMGDLTHRQMASVKAFTGNSYASVNLALRKAAAGGKMDSATKDFVRGLNQALDQAPRYMSDTPLYRGIANLTADQVKEMVNKARAGDIDTWHGFTSTSKDKEVAAGFGGEGSTAAAGSVTIVINNHSGKGVDVKAVSSVKHESEVLFKSGTRVKYTEAKKRPDGGWILYCDVL